MHDTIIRPRTASYMGCNANGLASSAIPIATSRRSESPGSRRKAQVNRAETVNSTNATVSILGIHEPCCCGIHER